MEISFPQGLPPEHWRRLINEYALILPDTTLRLKFTRNVLKHFHDVPTRHGFHSSRSELEFREGLKAEIKKLLPGSDALVIKAIRNGDISRPPSKFLNAGWRKRSGFLFVLAVLILGISIASLFWYDLINGNHHGKAVRTDFCSVKYPVPDRLVGYPKLDHLLENQIPFQPLKGQSSIESGFEEVVPDRKPRIETAKGKDEGEDFPKYIERPIWLVEKTADMETYSNRLQIITSFSVENIPRSYIAFPKKTGILPMAESLSTEIRGILYHASEGDMAPFKPEKNRLLNKYSSQLIKYACRKKGYHYLIDRFGRVYRIVREEDAAFHAGNSVWADEDSIFLNLNHAFIGICFEGKGFEKFYEPGSTKPRIRVIDDTTINEAQIQSGKELTDWLRFHYGIPHGNCVPHGLASVYPKNRLIGYHLDLAHGFPFHQFGLRNKYREMIPSMVEFGFKQDHYFRKVLNGNIWPGIGRSEEYLKNMAKQTGISLKAYRKELNLRFDRYADWQKHLHNNLTTLQTPENDPGRDEIK